MPHEPQVKLPVMATVRECFALSWRHAGVFFAYAWPWLLVLSLVSSLSYWQVDRASDARAENSASEIVEWIASIAVPLAVGTFLAVPWHRYLILKETPDIAATYPFRKRMWAYFGIGVASFIPFIVAILAAFLSASSIFPENATPTGLLAIAPLVVAVIAFALVLASFMRFALIFPGLAVDGSEGLSEVFRASKDNAFRLAVGSLLAIFPSLALSFGLTIVLDLPDMQNRFARTSIGVLSDLFDMIVGMTIVTFLSLAYRFFREAADHSAAKQ